jgi:hypothetical protein
MAADHDVFQRRHVAEQADVLEGAGDAALGRLMRRIGQQRRAGEAKSPPSARRGRSAVEEGRLAGAVRADQAVDLAAPDGQRDIAAAP